VDLCEGEKVLFGSGGERIPGKLYLAEVEEVLQGDLSNGIFMKKEENYSFGIELTNGF